jgi:hypothetical protein
MTRARLAGAVAASDNGATTGAPVTLTFDYTQLPRASVPRSGCNPQRRTVDVS